MIKEENENESPGDGKVSKRPRYSTSPEYNSHSENGDEGGCDGRDGRDEQQQRQLSLEEFLREFPQYPEFMARCLVSCPFGTGQKLMALKASGYEIAEEDPLVHAVIDVRDANAVAYYNGGNYSLAAGAMGALPWPGGGVPPPGAGLPPRVAALPPAALGRFISTLPGVVNKSGEALTLFHFQSNHAVHSAGVAVKAQPQFRRVSAVTAAAFGVPPSPSPVSFVQLERMDGVPQVLPGFCEL